MPGGLTPEDLAIRDQIDAAIEQSDMTADLVAAGLLWPEADEHGDVVWRRPGEFARVRATLSDQDG